MKPYLNRRDFLKLAGLLPLSFAVPQLTRAFGASQLPQGEKKNVLLIIFDALSAYHVPLYGYQRETMPNLARLAGRAVVYHNHFAAGNFTTPGTASLLTGTLPWTHRAFRFGGTMAEPFATRNIFHVFQNYYRIAYSHNPLVNTLFSQFLVDLDELIPLDKLLLANDGFIQALFNNDEDIATVSWARAMKKKEDGYAYSLFLARLYEQYWDSRIAKFKPLFPGGLPSIRRDNYFLLEQAIDWTESRLGDIPRPFLGYFHYMPPHFPYKTHRDFYGQFGNDGWKPVDKPVDLFTEDKSPEFLLARRTEYDEFLLYVDREFGRLCDYLEASGLLENTWVVFTSDHGEMFERGIWSHSTPVLYQPVIRIPLLIFEPGRETGMDVHAPTSAIDVLPTLLSVTGQEIPDWVEGVVLPPYGQTSQDPNRSVYALQARKTEQDTPIREATAMLVKGRYKLVNFFGYNELVKSGERTELYDIEADAEELDDLYPARKETGAELLGELKSKLAEVNAPYA